MWTAVGEGDTLGAALGCQQTYESTACTDFHHVMALYDLRLLFQVPRQDLTGWPHDLSREIIIRRGCLGTVETLLEISKSERLDFDPGLKKHFLIAIHLN